MRIILILPSAKDDIQRISDFLDLKEAGAQVELILDSIEHMGKFPYMGRVSRVDHEIREWLIPPYLIRCVIDPYTLCVLQVTHGASNWYYRN